MSLGRILLIPFGWRKVVHWTFTEFRYAFVHTMPEAEQMIWDTQIVPDSGGPSFRARSRCSTARAPPVSTSANPDRAPLLFIAGEADRAMPLGHRAADVPRPLASPAWTDFRSIPGRTHWLIAQDGWEEVAQTCGDWIESLDPIDQQQVESPRSSSARRGALHAGRGRARRASDSQGRNEVSAETPRSAGTQPKEATNEPVRSTRPVESARGEARGPKQQAAEMMRVTSDRDTGTLAYDWFLSADGTECEVREQRDADALVRRSRAPRERLGTMFAELLRPQMTFYGEPTPRLEALVNRIGVDATVFSLLQALEPAVVR